MVYQMRNYLFLTDYAYILPGTLIDIVLGSAFEDVLENKEIMEQEFPSLSEELSRVKSEDGVKMIIYLRARDHFPLMTAKKFDKLLKRIDDLLDDVKADAILRSR